ncbi:hypothetical protein AK88_02492 [Plasmodium fragile]|uniref:Trs120/TRAPPC9 first Ig-like domain-containing protein n=1 Tax=Plasmodium fragile TaxID=5857 RepID=A0A0D9QLR2_PLAFR|nr:uncharacterized protein AK88_02492 [Plasmodium fragile]KJP87888.1 hypothetical protein AK88_02492 [Plasmodium fragile]
MGAANHVNLGDYGKAKVYLWKTERTSEELFQEVSSKVRNLYGQISYDDLFHHLRGYINHINSSDNELFLRSELPPWESSNNHHTNTDHEDECFFNIFKNASYVRRNGSLSISYIDLAEKAMRVDRVNFFSNVFISIGVHELREGGEGTTGGVTPDESAGLHRMREKMVNLINTYNNIFFRNSCVFVQRVLVIPSCDRYDNYIMGQIIKINESFLYANGPGGRGGGDVGGDVSRGGGDGCTKVPPEVVSSKDTVTDLEEKKKKTNPCEYIKEGNFSLLKNSAYYMEDKQRHFAGGGSKPLGRAVTSEDVVQRMGVRGEEEEEVGDDDVVVCSRKGAASHNGVSPISTNGDHERKMATASVVTSTVPSAVTSTAEGAGGARSSSGKMYKGKKKYSSNFLSIFHKTPVKEYKSVNVHSSSEEEVSSDEGIFQSWIWGGATGSGEAARGGGTHSVQVRRTEGTPNADAGEGHEDRATLVHRTKSVTHMEGGKTSATKEPISFIYKNYKNFRIIVFLPSVKKHFNIQFNKFFQAVLLNAFYIFALSLHSMLTTESVRKYMQELMESANCESVRSAKVGSESVLDRRRRRQQEGGEKWEQDEKGVSGRNVTAGGNVAPGTHVTSGRGRTLHLKKSLSNRDLASKANLSSRKNSYDNNLYVNIKRYYNDVKWSILSKTSQITTKGGVEGFFYEGAPRLSKCSAYEEGRLQGKDPHGVESRLGEEAAAADLAAGGDETDANHSERRHGGDVSGGGVISFESAQGSGGGSPSRRSDGDGPEEEEEGKHHVGVDGAMGGEVAATLDDELSDDYNVEQSEDCAGEDSDECIEDCGGEGFPAEDSQSVEGNEVRDEDTTRPRRRRQYPPRGKPKKKSTGSDKAGVDQNKEYEMKKKEGDVFLLLGSPLDSIEIYMECYEMMKEEREYKNHVSDANITFCIVLSMYLYVTQNWGHFCRLNNNEKYTFRFAEVVEHLLVQTYERLLPSKYTNYANFFFDTSSYSGSIKERSYHPYLNNSNFSLYNYDHASDSPSSGVLKNISSFINVLNEYDKGEDDGEDSNSFFYNYSGDESNEKDFYFYNISIKGHNTLIYLIGFMEHKLSEALSLMRNACIVSPAGGQPPSTTSSTSLPPAQELFADYLICYLKYLLAIKKKRHIFTAMRKYSCVTERFSYNLYVQFYIELANIYYHVGANRKFAFTIYLLCTRFFEHKKFYLTYVFLNSLLPFYGLPCVQVQVPVHFDWGTLDGSKGKEERSDHPNDLLSRIFARRGCNVNYPMRWLKKASEAARLGESPAGGDGDGHPRGERDASGEEQQKASEGALITMLPPERNRAALRGGVHEGEKNQGDDVLPAQNDRPSHILFQSVLLDPSNNYNLKRLLSFCAGEMSVRSFFCLNKHGEELQIYKKNRRGQNGRLQHGVLALLSEVLERLNLLSESIVCNLFLLFFLTKVLRTDVQRLILCNLYETLRKSESHICFPPFVTLVMDKREKRRSRSYLRRLSQGGDVCFGGGVHEQGGCPCGALSWDSSSSGSSSPEEDSSSSDAWGGRSYEDDGRRSREQETDPHNSAFHKKETKEDKLKKKKSNREKNNSQRRKHIHFLCGLTEGRCAPSPILLNIEYINETKNYERFYKKVSCPPSDNKGTEEQAGEERDVFKYNPFNEVERNTKLHNICELNSVNQVEVTLKNTLSTNLVLNSVRLITSGVPVETYASNVVFLMSRKKNHTTKVRLSFRAKETGLLFLLGVSYCISYLHFDQYLLYDTSILRKSFMGESFISASPHASPHTASPPQGENQSGGTNCAQKNYEHVQAKMDMKDENDSRGQFCAIAETEKDGKRAHGEEKFICSDNNRGSKNKTDRTALLSYALKMSNTCSVFVIKNYFCISSEIKLFNFSRYVDVQSMLHDESELDKFCTPSLGSSQGVRREGSWWEGAGESSKRSSTGSGRTSQQGKQFATKDNTPLGSKLNGAVGAATQLSEAAPIEGAIPKMSSLSVSSSSESSPESLHQVRHPFARSSSCSSGSSSSSSSGITSSTASSTDMTNHSSDEEKTNIRSSEHMDETNDNTYFSIDARHTELLEGETKFLCLILENKNSQVDINYLNVQVKYKHKKFGDFFLKFFFNLAFQMKRNNCGNEDKDDVIRIREGEPLTVKKDHCLYIPIRCIGSILINECDVRVIYSSEKNSAYYAVQHIKLRISVIRNVSVDQLFCFPYVSFNFSDVLNEMVNSHFYSSSVINSLSRVVRSGGTDDGDGVGEGADGTTMHVGRLRGRKLTCREINMESYFEVGAEGFRGGVPLEREPLLGGVPPLHKRFAPRKDLTICTDNKYMFIQLFIRNFSGYVNYCSAKKVGRRRPTCVVETDETPSKWVLWVQRIKRKKNLSFATREDAIKYFLLYIDVHVYLSFDRHKKSGLLSLYSSYLNNIYLYGNNRGRFLLNYEREELTSPEGRTHEHSACSVMDGSIGGGKRHGKKTTPKRETLFCAHAEVLEGEEAGEAEEVGEDRQLQKALFQTNFPHDIFYPPVVLKPRFYNCKKKSSVIIPKCSTALNFKHMNEIGIKKNYFESSVGEFFVIKIFLQNYSPLHLGDYSLLVYPSNFSCIKLIGSLSSSGSLGCAWTAEHVLVTVV